MRVAASICLIFGLGTGVRAQDVRIAPLPQPEMKSLDAAIFDRSPAAAVDRPTAPDRAAAELDMPPLPPAIAVVPQFDAPVTSPDRQPEPLSGAARNAVAVPDLPQPADAGLAILSRPADDAGPALTASASASDRRRTLTAPGSDEFPATDLPPLPDPNAAIAMLPPRAPAPAVPQVPPETSRPAPRQDAPLTAPPAAVSMDRDALDRAFVALGRLQGLSGTVVQSARESYDRLAQSPVWTQDGRLGMRATQLVRTVGQAETHGLSPARFHKLRTALADAGDVETREAAATLLALAYARDARGARINPQQVSRLITAPPSLPEPEDVLARMITSADAGAALESFHPSHPGYLALRRKLAELAAPVPAASDKPKLTFGPVLTQGMTDPRVPILRDLLGLPASDTAIMDAEVVTALRAFQRDHRLRVTGRLDRSTTRALGGEPETEASARDPRADIIANMERWRWLPLELGADHVFVNVPDFQLTLVQDNRTAWKTRVIVGKPETQTPVFSHKMQFLVVNPSWNVPPSIALKEYLPLLQRNPQALSARGLQVVSRGRVVDPASVDWSKVGRTVAIRQPPGERNALGHIKFMFPNQHAVYLHDTPNRSLFANERRAYSHGCVRVQDPFRLAEAVMGADWSEKRLRSMIGGGERQINLPGELPVHLAYFTTFVDDAGLLQAREDLYGHNRKVKALLGL